MTDETVTVDVEAEGEGLEAKLKAIPGVSALAAAGPNRFRMLADRDVRPEAAAAVVNAGGKLRQLAVDDPSLEAIYSRFFQQQAEEQAEVRHAA